MRPFIITFFYLFLYSTINAQEGRDTCSITPYYIVSVEGIGQTDSLTVAQVRNIKRLIPKVEETSIVKFHVVSDCNGCSVEEIIVYGDTIPADIWARVTKKLFGIHGGVLYFSCITGKLPKGSLIAYKPFYFFIKP